MSHSSYFSKKESHPISPIIQINEIDAENFNIADLPTELPILPLRNTVFFPQIVIPITVSREKNILAVKESYKTDKYIAVLAQKDPETEDPEFEHLYTCGTVAKILKLITMPDGGTTIIIQGIARFELLSITSITPFLKGNIMFLEDKPNTDQIKFDTLLDSIKDQFSKLLKFSTQSNDALFLLKNIDSPNYIIYFISSNLTCPIEDKQELLTLNNIEERAEKLIFLLNNEINYAELKNKVINKTKTEIDKQQKEYFLQQQLKSINEELGNENNSKEIEEMKRKAENKKWSEDIKNLFDKNIKKLERMHPYSPDYSVIFNHLDVLLDLPWNELTTDNYDLDNAAKILDDDHYGMEKIKMRILEFLAVLKLKGDMKSPILCFVGPPGIGKTSLGKSISRALERKYGRISLGGLHDESEIRGHRKTYIGAMPGRIIQTLKKCNSANPVIILDEIDKMGVDYKGDPSSALLEVLDPEQNHSFYDNYIEAEFDLSKVLFIATANNLQQIQPALRDRLEIIELSGYATEEKIQIGKKHLTPKQKIAHGLQDHKINISNKIYELIISQYTRESGVRELDRKIAALMRNIAKNFVQTHEIKVPNSLEELQLVLGMEKFPIEKYKNLNTPGVVPGLAWTAVGGDILFIETVLYPGEGKIHLTGNLGNVMKESANTAFAYIKANASKWYLTPEIFKTQDIHIHVPEGATPKDGPSAGITILTAILSAFTKTKINPHFAMTGEITLRGQVTAVGGIKEKILAAKREGFKNIILCFQNKKDVEEIEKSYIKGLQFTYVEHIDQVIKSALDL